MVTKHTVSTYGAASILNASKARKIQNFYCDTNHSFIFLLACDFFSTSFRKELTKFCKNN